MPDLIRCGMFFLQDFYEMQSEYFHHKKQRVSFSVTYSCTSHNSH